MKKILLAVLCTVLALTLCGCMQQGPSYENLDTAQSVDVSTVSQADYKNDLAGLVSYLKALNYLPKNTDPTDMLAEVIGAKKGVRYIFNVDNSNVVVELYEYDTASLDANAQRVIGEIKEKGEFHLFNKDGVDTDTAYPALLSDNGKYMMIYTDGSSNQGNVTRKKLVEETFKSFYSDKTKADASDASKADDTSKNDASDASKADASDTSKAA